MTKRQMFARALIAFGLGSWVVALGGYFLHAPKTVAPTAFIVGLIPLAIGTQLKGGFR